MSIIKSITIEKGFTSRCSLRFINT